VNYTSGLPQDNIEQPVAVPPYLPEPYAMPGMLSYLNESPPSLSRPNASFSYSNLAFAIMSAIIAAEDNVKIPVVHAFVRKMREHVFKPLGLSAKFFNEASLAELPLGFNYVYWPSPEYSHPGYWPQAPGHTYYPAYFGSPRHRRDAGRHVQMAPVQHGNCAGRQADAFVVGAPNTFYSGDQ
jgi:CubicO group peptidase (beta-lactamase class C family)